MCAIPINGRKWGENDVRDFSEGRPEWCPLKEQEPVEPTINEYGEAYCICGENVGIIPNSKSLPKIRTKYCSECGRRMKWKYD
jgi:hypothetical protein